jgi:hypothetical protein
MIEPVGRFKRRISCWAAAMNCLLFASESVHMLPMAPAVLFSSSCRFFPGDVDAFTRTAFEQRGWPPLGRPLETPSVDPAAAQKNSSFSVLKQSSTTTFSPPNRAAALLDVHPVGVPTAGSFRTASTFVSSLTSTASRRHMQPSHAPPHAG